jgi:nitrogen fixation protein FixH
MPANTAVPSTKGQLKGWHALIWFLGFFGFMFVVNGIFLWTAITTFPGEDVDKSYLAGVDYNHELARRAAQETAGWQAEIGSVRTGEAEVLTVRLMTRDGLALPAFETHALLRHPANRNLDQTLALTANGGGEYLAHVEGLAPGTWTVEITADVDPERPGHEFKATREVSIP